MNNKKLRTATFDLETNGLLDTVTQVWCCVVKDHSDGSVFVWANDDPARLLAHLSTFDTLVGHNCIGFDFPVLRKLYGWEYEGKKIDTLVMSRTQRPNRQGREESKAGPHSVEAWGLRLGYPKVQNEVWDHYHPTILVRCKQDVEIQYHIYQALIEEGKGEGWGMAHRLNMKLFDLLQRQEEYGWTLDRKTLDDNIKTLHYWIDRIDRSVSSHLPLVVEPLELKSKGEYSYVKKPFLKNGTHSKVAVDFMGDSVHLVVGPFTRIVLRTVDLNSNKETKEFLLKQGWIPTEWNTNDKGERTSPKFGKDDEFVGIQGGLGKLIARRVQCRHRLSTLEGWRNLIRPDGRVSTPIAGIATTGRLRHKEIVNVPNPKSKAFFAKAMRSCFVAKEGWVMVGVDSKGNQARQLAARMGDEEFTRYVLMDKDKGDKEDYHDLNQRRSGAESRSKSKNFFYGFIFGAQPPKIATTLGITLSKAKELVERYMSYMPGLGPLIAGLVAQWRATAKKYYNSKYGRWEYRDGYILGLDGRRIYVDSEHKLLCYQLQSDEAIQLGAAYCKAHSDLEKQGYKYKVDWGMCLWMHDEFQIECKPDIAEHVGRIVSGAIAWAGTYYKIQCPHEGSYNIGKNWYETH